MVNGALTVDQHPTPTMLKAQIDELEHQTRSILFLSIANLTLNVLTICVGFLLSV